MEFSQIIHQIRHLTKTEVKDLWDAAAAVACGSTNRTAEQIARDVISIIEQDYPELAF